MLERTIATPSPIDLQATLAPLQRGPWDPTTRVRRDEMWRATRTPEGPVTVNVASREDAVTVKAWGAGAEWALENAPDLVGCNDDTSGFDPEAPALHRLHRLFPGLRMCRSHAVVEALVPTIIEQKVPSVEAHASYRRFVVALGEPAPGPRESRLMVPPDPATLACLPYFAFHRFGIERKRSDVIRNACGMASRLEATDALTHEAARRILLALPGVGPWTAAEVTRVARGDADAVRPGDYHLPHLVSWVLTGEPVGSDEQMMELLKPYRGHRARAARLIELGGSRPPRRAPRAKLRAIAAI